MVLPTTCGCSMVEDFVALKNTLVAQTTTEKNHGSRKLGLLAAKRTPCA